MPTPLRDGFYPEGHLSLKDRPAGWANATEWLEASQRQRRGIYDALPDVAGLSDVEVGALVHDIAMTPDLKAEINAGIEHSRAQRELYDLFDSDPKEYFRRYEAMDEAEQSRYDKWEDMWQAMGSTAEKGIPAWDQVFDSGLLGGDSASYQQSIAAMSPDERRVYADWAAVIMRDKEETIRPFMDATTQKGLPPWRELLRLGLDATDDNYQQYINLMSNDEKNVFSAWSLAIRRDLYLTSADLSGSWKSPDSNPGRNKQYWARYNSLPALEKTYHDKWMGLLIADLQSRGEHPAMNLLYDVWRNTGEDKSPVWGSFVKALVNAGLPENSPLIGRRWMYAISLHERLKARQASDRAVALGSALAGPLGEATASAAGKTGQQFAAIYALRHSAPHRYLQAIDALPRPLWKAYNLWEISRSSA